MFKKILLAGLMATSLGTVPLVALARPVFITVAPPAPRQEVIPAPRLGYVWANGHWEWRQQRHAWIPGHWIRARRGYAYESPRWIQQNGRWQMEQGRWARTARDRDGDGVPNRMDRAPNNPNRN